MDRRDKQLIATISKMTLQCAEITKSPEGHLIATIGYEHTGMSTHYEFLNAGIEVNFK